MFCPRSGVQTFVPTFSTIPHDVDDGGNHCRSTDFVIHTACTLSVGAEEKSALARDLAVPTLATYGHSGEGSGRAVLITPRVIRPSGNSGESANYQGHGVRRSGRLHRLGQVRPVALPHPRRCGASACRAKGRSATRSDSQRSRRRTLRPGQAAWGWKPELLVALPRTGQSLRRWQEEEQWESIPWLRVTGAETARHPLDGRAVSIGLY